MEWKLTLTRAVDDEDEYCLVLYLAGSEFLRFPINREQVYELGVYMLATARGKSIFSDN